MFYLKAEIAEGVTIKTEICDNVFTICPECSTARQGREAV